MNRKRNRRFKLAASMFTLLMIGGCLGPNPGFFITSTAAGAAISTTVSRLVSCFLDSQQ